jgi:transketolase
VRDAFAGVLLAARESDERLYVLDGDCARSTRTSRLGQRYPGSFLNAGIAEQNMVGMAAGLALAGLRPVVSGFASIVVGRAAEQLILSVALPDLPVTVVGHYAGLSGALEGAPHHATTDLAVMRAIPNMRIWVPADDADVLVAGGLALAASGPAYLRLTRDPVPPVSGGRWHGDGLRIWDRDGAGVAIVAAGIPVGAAITAAEHLAADGIRATVAAVLRVKPLPAAELLAAVAGTRLVVTVEEHSRIGGLGSAVAELCAERGGPRVVRLGIGDWFTETGSHPELLAKYGLDGPGIAASTRAAWREDR